MGVPFCTRLISAGAGDFLDSPLFYRDHKWIPIPRIVNEGCLLGLRKKEASDQEPVSFWCAVLRGRIPTLALLSHEAIRGYASYSTMFRDKLNREAERQRCLAAFITGSIEYYPKTRIFRAYSYISERLKGDKFGESYY
jgi:hypothetical protein